MQEIKKTCKKHGDLTIDNIIVNIRNSKDYINKTYFRCRICKRASDAASNRRNYHKRKDRERFYHKTHAEKYKEYKNNYMRRCVNTLSDNYIRQLLIKRSDLKFKDITEGMVKAKREHLKLLRELKGDRTTRADKDV